MNQDPLFELTSSPYLNKFIIRTKELYSGDITDLQYKESVKALNQYRRDFRSFMRNKLKETPITPLISQETKKIEAALEKLRTALEQIYRYFSDKNRTNIEEGLFKCKDIFEEIQGSINRISAEDASAKKYSESPVQNELMRLGYALLEKRVAPQPFNEKSKLLLHAMKKYYTEFSLLQPTGAEREWFAEHADEMKSVVRDYIKALEEARSYLTNSNPEAMKRGLINSGRAADKLLEFQNTLAELQRYKRCMKCGTLNEAAYKYCKQCNAVMPVNLESSESIDFSQSENGEVDNTNRVSSELARDVVNAVSHVKSRAITQENFQKFIRSVLDKVHQAQHDKEKIKLPNELKGEHEASPIFIQIEELICSGLDDAEEGLRKMELYSSSANESQLIFGMEEFLSGTARLSQAQKLTSQVLARR